MRVEEARSEAAQRGRGSILGYAAAGYLAIALSFITSPLQARALGPSGRGELAAIVTYSWLAILILGAGLPVAVKRACAVQPGCSDGVLTAALRFAALSTLGALALTLALEATVFANFSRSGRLGVLVLLSMTPVGVARGCFQGRLVADGALGTLSRARFISLAASMPVVVFLFASGHLSVFAAASVVGAALLAELIILWKGSKFVLGGRTELRPLLTFGMRSLPGGIAEASNLSLDQAFMASLVAAALLGNYAIAVTLATLPVILAQAIASRYFGEIGTCSPELRPALISESIRLVCLAAILASAALAALAVPSMVPVLYGRGFDQVIPAFFILLPGTVWFSMTYAATSALTALGLPGRAAVALLCGTALTVGLIVPMTHAFGIEGAALLSDATYLVSCLVALGFLRRNSVRETAPRLRDLVVIIERLYQMGWRYRIAIAGKGSA